MEGVLAVYERRAFFGDSRVVLQSRIASERVKQLVVEKSPLSERTSEWEDREHVPAT